VAWMTHLAQSREQLPSLINMVTKEYLLAS
jgi:hypothetical protein